MIIEQTVEIPDSRRVQFSPEVPVGRFRIVFFPDPPVDPKTGPHEELPKVTRAEIAAARQDPVIRELDSLHVDADWSWIPEGLTPETLTSKDIRALRAEEMCKKYESST
jgi:hypothetical protein